MSLGESTYFVVDTTELSGLKVTVMNRDDDPMFPWWKEHFDEPDFPLVGMSAVPVTSSLLEQVTWETAALTAVPDGVQIKASGRRASMPLNTTHDVDTGFGRVESRLADLTVAESIACDMTNLFVSGLSADGCHRFLTARRDAVYVKVDCRVRFRIKCWYDLPRCRAILQWLSRLAHPSSMDGIWPPRKTRIGSLRPVKIEAKASAEDDCRSALCREAQRTGPRVGSFIPCELYFAGEVYERDCIAEVTGPPGLDGQSCTLHLLTDRGIIRCGRGFTLQSPDWKGSVRRENGERFIELAEVMDAGSR